MEQDALHKSTPRQSATGMSGRNHFDKQEFKLSVQPFNRVILRIEKTEMAALVALVDKISQGLAGILGEVTEDRSADSIVHEFLYNFSSNPGGQPKEIFDETILGKCHGGHSALILE